MRALYPSHVSFAACLNLESIAVRSIWTYPAACPNRASSSSHDGLRQR